TDDFRIVGRVLADHEERRLDALVSERLQYGRGRNPRAVVERQDNLFIAKEVMLAEVLEAEARTTGGVDFDRAGRAERVGIAALRRGLCAAGGSRRGIRGGRRARRGCESGGLLAARRRRESRSGRNQRRRRTGC